MKTSYLRENIRRILREESYLRYNPIKTIIKEVSNGNIPDSNLIAIDTPSGGKGTAKLNSKAAKDFNDMVKAAKSENVEITYEDLTIDSKKGDIKSTSVIEEISSSDKIEDDPQMVEEEIHKVFKNEEDYLKILRIISKYKR